MEPKRLNKFISDSGMCSRREADKLLEQGRVTVNGKLPKPGTMVTAKDKVRVDDQLLNVREEEPVMLAFHKPAGIAVTTDLSVRNNIIRALNYPASILPIGHLDRDEEGLIFLSNDSEVVRKMTKADNRFQKEYVVHVDKPITSEFLTKLGSSGENTEPGEEQKHATVTKEATTRFRIVLEPGTNHHVKRMCEALGYKVQHLQRVRIESIKLAKLPGGHWRAMTESEIAQITSILAQKYSKPTAAAKGRGGAKTYSKTRTEATGSSRTRETSALVRPAARPEAPARRGAAKPAAERGTRGAAKSAPRPTDRKSSSGPKSNTGRGSSAKGAPKRGR
ncbi:pseudouridine synthase [Pontibacter qinzhouensis]|uniref:Pseudouridine synthase n=1 Tax=Pontibacter qinzhouensis TaxID=2603253 RepID=A0A5C8IKE2_9BACT|nr:pseudouridine synthase [Pontibacter qinzhouensis]TXK21637.1 pseudouridine synthase [Pontibacter qinzhouensis]